MVEFLPSMCKTLGLIHSIHRHTRRKYHLIGALRHRNCDVRSQRWPSLVEAFFSLFSYCDKGHDQEQLGEARVYFILQCIVDPGETKLETQDSYLEVRAEAEAM